VPAEGQVAVVFAAGAKGVKVKSAPAGVTVAGGVKKGRLAVAVVRPRGVAAKGKVTLTLRGRARGVKRIPAALDGGRAPAGCSGLAGLLAKRLKGSADVKALGGVLAAKLCGKPAPAGADAVLSKLALGAPAAPPARPGTGAPGSGSLRPGGGAPRPAPPASPAPSPTPTPGDGTAQCDNDVDDDGDGQTDWEDPGCSDAGDGTESGEVPVSAECAESSAVGMSSDPTSLFAAINSGCGEFVTIEVDVAPGPAACKVFTADSNFDCAVSGPFARATARDGKATDLADILIDMSAPVNCARPATIALYRPNGEVAELREPVFSCTSGPAPAAECANGQDDDGDGMIDSRDAAGTTDPDPGCASTSDTSEDSEVPSPATCDIQVGIFDGDVRLPGLQLQGCGVIKGVWFKPPGTPTGCLFRVGAGNVLECSVKAGTGGASFAPTDQQVVLATPIAADPVCAPITVTLLRDNGEVYADRVDWC
jgi:hypothetical protein